MYRLVNLGGYDLVKIEWELIDRIHHLLELLHLILDLEANRVEHWLVE